MNKYSQFEKILHRQFLANNTLSNFFFERLLEKSKFPFEAGIKNHLFITGLARSGTTALLNKIYQTNNFASLLYRHMPFVLSPRLSGLFSKLSNISEDPIERYHNDGIFINTDSPECLDEPFWIKASIEWYSKEFLEVLFPDEKYLRSYSYLLSSFAEIQGKKRLLIKNNNNHLRLESLSNFFKKSSFILVFRDPLLHAKSLLNQHQNFTRMHTIDPFSLEYMNLIGHREFGLNIAPFVYPEPNKNSHLNLDNNKLSYWLAQWIETYSWIINSGLQKKSNINLVCYESLCNDKRVFEKICSIHNIKNEKNQQNKFIFKLGNSVLSNSEIESLDIKMINQSREIYTQLKEFEI